TKTLFPLRRNLLPPFPSSFLPPFLRDRAHRSLSPPVAVAPSPSEPSPVAVAPSPSTPSPSAPSPSPSAPSSSPHCPVVVAPSSSPPVTVAPSSSAVVAPLTDKSLSLSLSPPSPHPPTRRRPRHGLSVRDTQLPVPPAVLWSSGTIVDSGTNLPAPAYTVLPSAFRSTMSGYPRGKTRSASPGGLQLDLKRTRYRSRSHHLVLQPWQQKWEVIRAHNEDCRVHNEDCKCLLRLMCVPVDEAVIMSMVMAMGLQLSLQYHTPSESKLELLTQLRMDEEEPPFPLVDRGRQTPY
ncbi:hypothetical protein Taro_050819, partial [Colocasia esculenta]|nr:hypothetical protein [Colocasia esculenta]